jgi:DNA polymerase elongation subunit (family B)
VDTYLVYKIDQKMQHTMLAMQLAFLAKCAFADVISAMRLWESIIYGHFIEQNIVEEFVKPKNHKENIVGAFVLEPVPGKYGHTFSIDAEQLYPSMMMQHNISPETVLRVIEGVSIESILRGEFPQDFNPETECLSANGLVTTKSVRGFIPELVDLMGKRRKVTKKKMLELKSEQELIKAELKTLGVVIDE